MYVGVTFFIQWPCGHLDCSLVEEEAVADKSAPTMKVRVDTVCWLCQQPTKISELVTLSQEEVDAFLETCKQPLKDMYGRLISDVISELIKQNE